MPRYFHLFLIIRGKTYMKVNLSLKEDRLWGKMGEQARGEPCCAHQPYLPHTQTPVRWRSGLGHTAVPWKQNSKWGGCLPRLSLEGKTGAHVLFPSCLAEERSPLQLRQSTQNTAPLTKLWTLRPWQEHWHCLNRPPHLHSQVSSSSLPYPPLPGSHRASYLEVKH